MENPENNFERRRKKWGQNTLSFFVSATDEQKTRRRKEKELRGKMSGSRCWDGDRVFERKKKRGQESRCRGTGDPIQAQKRVARKQSRGSSPHPIREQKLQCVISIHFVVLVVRSCSRTNLLMPQQAHMGLQRSRSEDRLTVVWVKYAIGKRAAQRCQLAYQVHM